MRKHIWVSAFGSLAIAAGLTGGVIVGSVSAAAAAATDSSSASLTGCPNGYQLLNLDYMETISDGHYVLAAHVDSTGNNDGYVCGNQMPPSVAADRCKHEGPDSPPCYLIEHGLPVYIFLDNVNPGHTA
jgi:hypothetical protein